MVVAVTVVFRALQGGWSLRFSDYGGKLAVCREGIFRRPGCGVEMKPYLHRDIAADEYKPCSIDTADHSIILFVWFAPRASAFFAGRPSLPSTSTAYKLACLTYVFTSLLKVAPRTRQQCRFQALCAKSEHELLYRVLLSVSEGRDEDLEATALSAWFLRRRQGKGEDIRLLVAVIDRDIYIRRFRYVLRGEERRGEKRGWEDRQVQTSARSDWENPQSYWYDTNISVL
ncbi:hypothetical protein G7K_6365-t1 [Saitoella complicata NRRL Y-17804]|uniref:Uncharacterized protein n=1 Tax=Saitoella complicata (strain BCRC 22490 / CBS 7301 / JCM 7358 / NBRC 10748 / NRRL Y-17804) TaxID=698492 RepID=A0A0E9NS64_SAICN|nr:hypothetical protein G7K_6365-t1 [Saitoella complicata NRRL Y-17804]